jgi:predicted esterase
MFDPGRRFLVLGLLAAGCSTGGAPSAVDAAIDRAADTQSPGASSDSRGETGTPGTPADGGRDAAPQGAEADGGGSAGGPELPVPAGACPEFTAGDVTFNPAGGARTVTITMGDAARTQRGPLIVYWYATGSSVREAAAGLPLPAITAAGGIVVAPQDVPDAGTFPWLQNLARHDSLFDEIVGCAVQKTMIDPRRIHAVGFSAGGLMTTHLSYARSRLLASVAVYSGGATGQFQEPDNKFPALIFTGGPGDIVIIDFFQSSQQWQTTLKNAGHFALLCNHGGGHSIPARLVPGVWQFFQDHPYGTNPSPYAGGKTPAGLAPPCVE